MIRATAPATDARRATWPGETLDALLPRAAGAAPAAIAVRDDERALTHAELAAAVERMAAALAALGVRPGSVVTAQLPNWWETQVLMHATWRLGAVLNPVIPVYRERELSFICREARPSVLVVPHVHRGHDHVAMVAALRAGGAAGFDAPVVVVRPSGALPDGFLALDGLAGDAVAPAPASGADDVALLLYTSGTTGAPKGVLHTHGTLLCEVDSIIGLARLGEADRVFMPSPLGHITGVLYGSILTLRLAIGCTLLDRWDPARARELVRRDGCTFTVAASPFLHGLAEEHAAAGEPSSLRVFICGGADVPAELVRRARTAMGTRVVRTYGSTEMPTLCCGDPYGDADLGAETDGVPIGAAVARLDAVADGVGELCVAGDELFVGYLDPAANEDAFTADGLFRTGDLASIDARGAVTIRGRRKDLIIRGGENLSAKEIEDLLFEHEAVLQVAVVGAPDAVLGERPFAFVVPRPGATLDLTDVQSHLRARGLAKPKWPEGLALVDELPMTASGKVQKFELRRMLRDAPGGPSGPGRREATRAGG